jgi:defect-in-organelle-trafficking protein DotD
VSLRWAGPIGGVIKRLAQRARWDFEEVGNAPVSKIPVFIDTKNQSIAQVLRNIGYQAGARADVIVNPSVPSLTVAYHE